LIKQALQLTPKYLQISGAFQIFQNISIDLQNETIRIKNQEFSPGKIVVTQLKNASPIALFVCTAGAGISDFSKQKAAEGDDMRMFYWKNQTPEKFKKKIFEQLEISIGYYLFAVVIFELNTNQTNQK
jgi:hypothetical protein